MARKGGFGAAVLVVAAMAVVAGFSAAAGGAEQAAPRFEIQPAPLETWLNVEKLTMLASIRPSGDSFIISATFNCAPHSCDPAQDVTLWIDGLPMSIPAAAWTQKGTSNRWGAKTEHFTAQIEWWRGESSRCELKMSGKNLAIHDDVPDWPFLSIELQIGSDYDFEIPWVLMDDRGARTWMEAQGPFPSFLIDMMGIKRNLKGTGKDAVIVKGRCYLEDPFDPAANGIMAQLGNYTFNIPVGTMQLSKDYRTLFYHGEIDGAKVSVVAKTQTGQFQIIVNGIDMSGMTNPITVRLTMTNLADAQWQYSLKLQTSPTGKLFRY